MTKFLSDVLQAREPTFRQTLQHLEAANGHPATDIRLSSGVMQETQSKLKQLGLDPRDTTPEELYHVLQERLKADDARLVKTLRTQAARYVSAEGDVVDGMIRALQTLPDTKRCFALKGSVLRRLLQQQPPKQAMKRLGYRSLQSFLKHETPAAMLAAARLCESHAWQRQLLEKYKRLQPKDFEERQITLLRPVTARWQRLAAEIVVQHKHNLVSLKELGALVFLPLQPDAPAGTVTASLSLALHELNELRAAASFLKLSQVRADFGAAVQMIVADEPHLPSAHLDQAVPWHLIQRYFAQAGHQLAEAMQLEPQLQREDLAWHPVEQSLQAIEASFGFWQQSGHLALPHQLRPVSLNVIDAALNCCNKLPFEQRIVHYFQRSLWHELLMRYLRPNSIEQAVNSQLQPQLAEEFAEAETTPQEAV